jgi:ATP-binding cassette subfamily C protein
MLVITNALSCLRWRAVLLFTITLLAGAFEGIGLTLLFPLLAKFGIGGAGQANPMARFVDNGLEWLSIPNELPFLLAFIVGIFYLQTLFNLARSCLEADCQTRYTQYWQRRLFNAFIDAGWIFLINEKSSTRISMIINETGRVSASFYLLAQMMAAVIFILVYAIISLATSWQMVTALALLSGAIYCGVRPLSRRGRAIGEKVTIVNENLQHRTTEFLQSAKLIKSTATEPIAKALFADVVNRYRRTFRLASIHPSLVQSIYLMFGYTFLGVGIWVAVDSYAINPATVIVAIYIFLRLYMQLTNFQQFRHGFAIVAPALPAILEQYEGAQAAAESLHGGQRLTVDGPGAVRLDAVTVRYSDKTALDRLSLEIPAGSFVGVTGTSGAGKSTLVDLIVGLVESTEGTILVDEVSLADLDLSQWRRSIGYVAQETLLLNGSVATNIAWGAKDADPAAIEEAARLANADAFISELPQSFDTEIGERGAWLSGGQRQRIGLARALIGKKRLLILDEATSALDSESEHEILKALEVLGGKVTILMVAHRLSTLKKADHILLMEEGRLIESGNWKELIDLDGVFARLWHLQSLTLDISSSPDVQPPPLQTQTKG